MGEKPLALIGMMGSGKSTVGRVLARELNREFLDSDAEIEERVGRSVAQIFRDFGEEAFREWESEVVREALDAERPAVIGVAGGAVLREETRMRLKQAHVVWLRAPIETLIERVKRRHLDRPMISNDPDGSMRALYEVREPIYESLADEIVDVDGRSPADIANTIMENIA